MKNSGNTCSNSSFGRFIPNGLFFVSWLKALSAVCACLFGSTNSTYDDDDVARQEENNNSNETCFRTSYCYTCLLSIICLFLYSPVRLTISQPRLLRELPTSLTCPLTAAPPSPSTHWLYIFVMSFTTTAPVSQLNCLAITPLSRLCSCFVRAYTQRRSSSQSPAPAPLWTTDRPRTDTNGGAADTLTTIASSPAVINHNVHNNARWFANATGCMAWMDRWRSRASR